jgi:hypothetical protein
MKRRILPRLLEMEDAFHVDLVDDSATDKRQPEDWQLLLLHAAARSSTTSAASAAAADSMCPLRQYVNRETQPSHRVHYIV